jgi:hypothetical protein
MAISYVLGSSLIKGLNKASVQAKVDLIDVKDFMFGKYFPVTKVNQFTWRTLTNQHSGVHVAADIVADNSSVARKRRPIFESVDGELPRLAIAREMNRKEIKDYYVALALAGNDTGAKQLVQYWSDDVEYCFTGVQSELEYIAWALASNAGKLAFTSTNNAAVATEFNLDYEVGDNQLNTVNTPFATKASADVIAAFVAAATAGKALGYTMKYAFCNLKTFYQIQSTDQIIKQCASYVSNLTGTSQVPDLAAVNAMLAKQAWLNGMQLIVIDQDITRELANGDSTTGNPFADDRIIFSPSAILGSTQYDILPDENKNIIRAERAHTVVKKYSIPEPQTEVTIGEADACPVLDSAYRNIYLRTDGNSW